MSIDFTQKKSVVPAIGVVETANLTSPMNPWDCEKNPPSWDAMHIQLNLPKATGYNQATVCLDGHPDAILNKTALLWVSATQEVEHHSFLALSLASNQVANALTALGTQPQDRIFLFLERIPELYVSFFGGLKCHAILCPIFPAFGPEALLDRLQDAEASIVFTSPALKPRIDAIASQVPSLKTIVVVDRAHQWQPNPSASVQELDYYQWIAPQSCQFTVAHTPAETPSIMHYTSGTTGKPKGALHQHGACIAQAATAQWVLDLSVNDVYWCTADPGWVTGTSYGIFGPWALGVTQLVFEGAFKPETWYSLLERFNVSVWYTAPTALRMLMKHGSDLPKSYQFKALRHICSVGEPLNPEAIIWGRDVFDQEIYDTWWQTETGSIHITNRIGLPVRLGSMGKPFPGVEACVLDDTFTPLPLGSEGALALKSAAPSMFKTYWNNQSKYESRFKNGWYLTGDRASVDTDGYFWFVGREDDVINTAGHLVGPFEVESALVHHPAVAEAGVIGLPCPERMEVIKAYISLKTGFVETPELLKEIALFVRSKLAAHAMPREIEVIESLPKTRSGKIMRRVLKARALGLPEGDTSTLEEG
jgi:acetyl-CoA synthetase